MNQQQQDDMSNDDAPAAVGPLFQRHLSQFRAATDPPPRTTSPRSVRLAHAPIKSTPSPRSRKAVPARRAPAPVVTKEGGSPYFPSASEESDETRGVRASDGPSPKKRKKPSRSYADPSVYADLRYMPDLLDIKKPVDLIIVGINPGISSAQTGHHYASPTNHFWKAMHGGGLTNRRLAPSEGHLLVSEYRIGSTNLVPRPSAEQSELSKAEMKACVPSLLQKLALHHPKWVAFVGLSICETVYRWLKERAELVAPPLPENPESPKAKRKKMLKISPGRQKFSVSHMVKGEKMVMKFWALPSTSARVVAYQLVDKIELFRQFKQAIDEGKCEMETEDDEISFVLEELLAADNGAGEPIKDEEGDEDALKVEDA